MTVKVNLMSQKDALGIALNAMIENLGDIVSDVKTSADNVASGSEELSSTSQQMSEGATEQAASAEQESSSMKEMSSNIRQNADNAQQTESISIQAADNAEKGRKAVAETVGCYERDCRKNRSSNCTDKKVSSG